MNAAPPHEPIQRGLAVVGGCLAGLGSLVIMARLAGWRSLVTILPGAAPMAFVTAVGFLLGGVALLALALGRKRVANAAALGVLLLGVGVLGVYGLARPIGWTNYVYAGPVASTGVGLDGRMAPNAAVAFVVLGLALVLIARGAWWPRVIIGFGAVLLGVGGLALVGYVTELRTASAWWRYTAMAVPSSVAFMVAGLGLVGWVIGRISAKERVQVRAFPFFALATAGLVVLGVLVGVSNEERAAAAQAVQHALAVEMRVERFIAATARMDTAVRNFALMGEARYVERVEVHRRSVVTVLDELSQLTANDPGQAKRLQALRETAERNHAIKLRQIEARRAGGVEAAAAEQRVEPLEIIQALRTGTDGLLAEQRRLVAQHEEKSRRDEQRLWGVLAFGGVGVVGLLSAAFSLVAGATRRLGEANEQLEERVTVRTQEAERASAEARETEARFRTALVDSPVPGMLWTADGKILLVNRVWQELSGYQAEELANLSDWTTKALGRPPPAALAEYLDQRFLVVSRSDDGQHTIRTKNGVERVWDFHTASIGRLPNGTRLLVSKAVDVTAQVETEALLRASEQRHRFLADMVPALVWTVPAAEGERSTYNRGWLDYTGLTVEESMGEGWLCVLHPDDAANCVAEWRQMLLEQRDGGGEYRLRRAADGQYRWFLWRAHPQRDAAGRLERWVGTSTDIHEQKLLAAELEQRVQRRTAEVVTAQEELAANNRLQRAVLDGNRFSIIATRTDGTIEIFSRGSEEMLGYAAAEMVGRCTPAVIHLAGEVVERAVELSASLGRRIEPGFEVFVAKAREGKAEEREWTYVRKDGARVPVMLSVTALHDAAGKITGFLGIAHDITRRKVAEAATQTARERLELIFRLVADGIVQHDASGKIIECNAAAERILGLTRDQLMGRSSVDPRWRTVKEGGGALAGEDHPAMYSLRTGRPLRDIVMGVEKPDGTTTWIDVRSEPLLGADGRAAVVVVSFSDVTEQRRGRLALEAERARLNLVLTEMPVGVRFVRRIDGHDEVVVNPAHEWITGVTKEVAARDPEAYLKHTHPEDAASQEEAMARMRSGALASYAMEKRFLLADGNVRWVSVSWSRRALPGAGNFEELSTVTDVTPQKVAQGALRESEERFRQAFDYAGIGMAIVGLDGRWLRVNRALCEIVGYDAETLMRKTFQEITHPEDLETDLAHVQELLAGKKRFYGMEKRYLHRDGSVVWINLTGSLVRDTAGAPVHFVAQIEDISERKRLGKNLAVARDQALEASRMKSEFLANMSHELRTPLNAVVGMSGLLADTELNEEQQEMARTIQGGAEGLLTVINDILDFSKIEAGKLHVEAVEFDLKRVVEEVVALLAPRAQEHGVEVACEFDSAAEGLVVGDGGRVRQVIINLLGNAVKFTERGEIAVTVRGTRVSAELLTVRLSVRDTGVGIAPAAQARLFQPFTQEDASTTRRFGGTGLGLAISRQLVELMGGEIGFESEQGKGSTFWFQLELVRGKAPTVVAPVTLPAGRRVLVVDDNETNRRITLGQLAKLGVVAEAVADGATALARLREPASGPWHAALLDWHMPHMDGLALAIELRTDTALEALPLVMLSSAGPNADIAAATAVGFAGFLTKPVSDGQLGRCLARVLGEGTMAVAPVVGAVPADRLRLRILLVEDNPANQRVASLMLLKLGHQVEIAVHGGEALERLAVCDFDVVLMDCQMPVLDGYETTRRIRSGAVARVNRRIPVIALTAYAMAGDRGKCIAAGMDDHLTKPVSPRDLLAALERCGFRGASVRPEAARPPATPLSANAAILDPEVLASARALPGTKGVSLLPELVEMYLIDERERLKRMRQLAAEHAEDDLAQEAHAFAGNAGSFGGLQVRRVALELERAAQAGDWAAVEKRAGELGEACGRLREEVVRLNLLTS